MSLSSLLKFLMGVLGSIPFSLQTSIYSLDIQVSCSNMVAKGRIPPSVIDISGAKTKSGSTLRIFPIPEQDGQAPCGELKEKVLGSISGSSILSTGHENLSENKWSENFLGNSGISKPLSCTWAKITFPLERLRAC